MTNQKTLPNTVNNSCFMILTKKNYYFTRFKLYQTNRFHIVFKQIWFNKIYFFCLPKCINIMILMFLWEKNIISCDYSSISMYVDMIWFNWKKRKLINGSEKIPNFGNQESKFDITYIKFLELKNGLDHHSGSKYERFLLEFTNLLRICFYY